MTFPWVIGEDAASRQNSLSESLISPFPSSLLAKVPGAVSRTVFPSVVVNAHRQVACQCVLCLRTAQLTSPHRRGSEIKRLVAPRQAPKLTWHRGYHRLTAADCDALRRQRFQQVSVCCWISAPHLPREQLSSGLAHCSVLLRLPLRPRPALLSSLVIACLSFCPRPSPRLTRPFLRRCRRSQRGYTC